MPQVLCGSVQKLYFLFESSPPMWDVQTFALNWCWCSTLINGVNVSPGSHNLFVASKNCMSRTCRVPVSEHETTLSQGLCGPGQNIVILKNCCLASLHWAQKRVKTCQRGDNSVASRVLLCGKVCCFVRRCFFKRRKRQGTLGFSWQSHFEPGQLEYSSNL